MKILIVGGGIAGFAMARALEQQGFCPDLVERMPNSRQGGAGLYLPGNAARALGGLRLLDEVTQNAVAIKTQKILDSSGKLLCATRTQDIWSSCGPCIALPRATLHNILHQSLRKTRLRFGLSVVGVIASEREARVTLSDNSTSTYDLVIGADGINSIVRQELFPASHPSYTGNVCWRFIIPDIVGIKDWTVMLGDGISMLALPIGGKQLYVYVDTAVSDPESMTDFSHLPRMQLLSNFSKPLLPLIESLPGNAKINFSRINKVVTQNWASGNVVLIGDAAHASSPSMAEGAAMAMEDALVLARSLVAKDTIKTALDDYVSMRRPRVEWVQRQSDARDKMRGLPRWARTSLLRFAGNALYKRTYKPLLDQL